VSGARAVVHQDRAGGGNLADHALAEGELRRPTPLTPASSPIPRAGAHGRPRASKLAAPPGKSVSAAFTPRADGLGSREAVSVRLRLVKVSSRSRTARLGVQAHVANGHGGLRHELSSSSRSSGPGWSGARPEMASTARSEPSSMTGTRGSSGAVRRPPVPRRSARRAHIRHSRLWRRSRSSPGAFPVRTVLRASLGHGLIRYRAPRDRVVTSSATQKETKGAPIISAAARRWCQDLDSSSEGRRPVDAGERPQPHGAPLEGVRSRA